MYRPLQDTYRTHGLVLYPHNQSTVILRGFAVPPKTTCSKPVRDQKMHYLTVGLCTDAECEWCAFCAGIN